MNKFFRWLFNKKEEEEKVTYPYHYAEIIYTAEAVEKGVFDDFQKIIKIWRGGIVIDERDYSIEEIIAIKKVYNIPILDRTQEKSEEHIFNELNALEGELIDIVR